MVERLRSCSVNWTSHTVKINSYKDFGYIHVTAGPTNQLSHHDVGKNSMKITVATNTAMKRKTCVPKRMLQICKLGKDTMQRRRKYSYQIFTRQTKIGNTLLVEYAFCKYKCCKIRKNQSASRNSCNEATS